MFTTIAASLMTIATSLSGILALLGAISAISLIAFVPTLKRSKSALSLASFVYFTASVVALVGALASNYFGGWSGFETQPGTKPASQLIIGDVNQRPDDLKHPADETATVTVEKISQVQPVHDSVFKPTKRDYVRILKAKPGYYIREARFASNKGNNVSDVQLHVAADGLEAALYFSLTSGPQFDRYNAWIDAEVLLTQNKIASSSDIPASSVHPGLQ
jgi:hypothetical protein